MHFNHLTIPLTIINKGALVNETHFTIKINTANYFLNNCVKLKRDTYFETKGVILDFKA